MNLKMKINSQLVLWQANLSRLYLSLVQLILQIASLRLSIASLQGEMQTDDNGDISTRLDIVFMADAALDFGSLDPSNLPNRPISLNVYILKDQHIILTKAML